MSASQQHDEPSRFSSATVLWASAFILLGLIFVQAGRLGQMWMNTARADIVSRVGDYTVLTTNATTSEDLAVVLDGRGEKLMIYRIKNREMVELVRGYDLRDLFMNAAKVGAGRVR